MSPSNIIITCHVEKDNNGQIYQDVYERNFSIIQTTGKELTVLSSGLQQGVYKKEYPVSDNKTADLITYKFKCSYTLMVMNIQKIYQ